MVFLIGTMLSAILLFFNLQKEVPPSGRFFYLISAAVAVTFFYNDAPPLWIKWIAIGFMVVLCRSSYRDNSLPN